MGSIFRVRNVWPPLRRRLQHGPFTEIDAKFRLTRRRETMTVPVKIGIVICNRGLTCAGGKYSESLEARVGAFRLYQGRVHPRPAWSYGGHRHPSDSSKILSDSPDIGNLGFSGMARENQARRERRSRRLRAGLVVRFRDEKTKLL